VYLRHTVVKYNYYYYYYRRRRRRRRRRVYVVIITYGELHYILQYFTSKGSCFCSGVQSFSPFTLYIAYARYHHHHHNTTQNTTDANRFN